MKTHEDHTEMLDEPEHTQATQTKEEPVTGMSLKLRQPKKKRIDTSTKPVQMKPQAEKKPVT
jgi:hypothetical protein